MFDEFKLHKGTIMLAGDNYMMTEGIRTLRLAINKNIIALGNFVFVPGLQCRFFQILRRLAMKIHWNSEKLGKKRYVICFCLR